MACDEYVSNALLQEWMADQYILSLEAWTYGIYQEHGIAGGDDYFVERRRNFAAWVLDQQMDVALNAGRWGWFREVIQQPVRAGVIRGIEEAQRAEEAARIQVLKRGTRRKRGNERGPARGDG